MELSACVKMPNFPQLCRDRLSPTWQNSCSDDQAVCLAMVQSCLGLHHVQNIKLLDRYAIRFSLWDGLALATHDDDQLTRLVVFAHAFCVRIHLVQSGPQKIGFILSRRNPLSESHTENHQTPTQLKAMIDRIDAISFECEPEPTSSP